MEDILIATANRGKAQEISEIFRNSGFNLHFLFEYPELMKINIQENASSFEGNALIKALLIGQAAGMLTLADDSGLCVDALKGAPGVLSARYSAEKTDIANNLKLLDALSAVPMSERDCHYHCSVAIYNPQDNFIDTVAAVWRGKVALEMRGDKSFGYAPIFLAGDFNYEKSNAECEPEELVVINHRGQAFKQALKILISRYSI
ncbi:MAG: non-canonical purine NTP pyrophosphatase [Patescibacteria group bacterium]|nr:non-canonical purine NTP pyrophosphatase [Patescibacteria group bacterium]